MNEARESVTAWARKAVPVDTDWCRRLWDHAPASVAVVSGASHTLVYANPAFERLCAGQRAGAGPPAASVLGQRVGDAFAPAGAPALVALLDEVRRGVGPVRGTITTGPAGSLDAWQCTAWSVADPGDSPVENASPEYHRSVDSPHDGPGLLVLEIDATTHSELTRARHRDLTELVLLSALREEARADAADTARDGAEQANAARAQFLAVTSHELRTPLVAIGGYADIMAMGLRGPVSDGQRDALARIQLGMQHLLGLATALLDYAKLEVGRVEYRIADVPVGEALRGALGLVTPQAAVKGVALDVTACDARLVVRADAAKLRQILLNLLANAIKFTAPGGAVSVSCEETIGAAAGGEAAPVAAIRVADTGRGIAAEELRSIFDPYVQVGRRVAAREEGVGLGLAISRDLACGMGGGLTAESTPGVGSTFTLTLPTP